MNPLLSVAFAALSSFFLSLFLIPYTRKVALLYNLVDSPNHRKMHTKKVPLIGGISIWISTAASLVVFAPECLQHQDIMVICTGATALLILGVIDDRFDIKASFKLVVQILLAYFVFANGLKVNSMYGVFGIYELPITLQYFMTIFIIAGVVNAINLMDGIDGLAAGLAIVTLLVFSALAWITGNHSLLFIFLPLVGALIGFLKFNFSKGEKIFMGDAGSLFLGFVTVVSALSLLKSAEQTEQIHLVLPTVISVLAIPVFDSLRVYIGRIKNGYSPFTADKTHLHHLVVFLGFNHKHATAFIVICAISVIALCVTIGSLFDVTMSIVAFILFFSFITELLKINNEINQWSEKMKILEL